MHKLSKQTKADGFTLVEIMTVIAIVGFLAAVGVGSYNQFREQARDTRRAADLQQLQVAIESYKDAYGKYPDAGCGATAAWMGPGPHSASWGDECDNYIVGLTPDFIEMLPNDPKDEGLDNLGYIYKTDGDDYKVLIHRTVEADDISYEDRLARCPRSCLVENPTNDYCNNTPGENPQQKTYAIYSAGGVCW